MAPMTAMSPAPAEAVLRPLDWPAACGALMSTRAGGVSPPPYDSLNLKAPPGDAAEAANVRLNRQRLAGWMGAQPVFLDQVHGVRVVRLGPQHLAADAPAEVADASICTLPGIACTVMVADCLPVLFADRAGRGVGAAHAGWRGLAGGVLEATVAALLQATGGSPGDLVAWVGAGIGPAQFEVGAEVPPAFGPGATGRFRPMAPRDGQPKWCGDLPGLALDRLRALGLDLVSLSGACTFSAPSRFFSFRRSPVTGRQAAACWLRG